MESLVVNLKGAGFNPVSVGEHTYELPLAEGLAKRIREVASGEGCLAIVDTEHFEGVARFTLSPHHLEGSPYGMSPRLVAQVNATKTSDKPMAPIMSARGVEWVTPREASDAESVKHAKPSAFALAHLAEVDSDVRVLDLGCGIGPNTHPYLKNGCSVVSIDRSEPAMKILEEEFASQAKSTRVLADITRFGFDGPYREMDLVLCVDVLPYIPSSELLGVLAKVHNALRPGGVFIGTLFARQPGQDKRVVMASEMMKAHFYPSQEFVVELLTEARFEVQAVSWREQGGVTPMALEFKVIKRGAVSAGSDGVSAGAGAPSGSGGGAASAV